MKATCVGCGAKFETKSPRAKWHDSACRKRAQRKRRVGPASTEQSAAKPETEVTLGSNLVAAVRRELEELDRLDSVDGQAALILAKQANNPDSSGAASLIANLRKVMAEIRTAATASSPPPEPDATSEEEDDDELEQARRRREAKARQAADRT